MDQRRTQCWILFSGDHTCFKNNMFWWSCSGWIQAHVNESKSAARQDWTVAVKMKLWTRCSEDVYTGCAVDTLEDRRVCCRETGPNQTAQTLREPRDDSWFVRYNIFPTSKCILVVIFSLINALFLWNERTCAAFLRVVSQWNVLWNSHTSFSTMGERVKTGDATFNVAANFWVLFSKMVTFSVFKF